MINIPISRVADDVSEFDLQATLDGAVYTIAFRWNVRASAWFFSVFDVEGETPHLLNQKCVVDYAIPQYGIDRTPPGLFAFVDTGAPAGQGEDPGFDDLGSRVQFWYVPESETGR